MRGDDLEELVVPDAEALRTWLLDNHETSPGVWLILTRKGGAVTSLTWQQAVDEALCVGWIDGQGRARDAESSSIRFTPRRPRSTWSQRNVANVARLAAEDRMLPAGWRAVEAAKADGRWQAAYAAQSEAEVPTDLAAADAADPAAQAMFYVLTKGNRWRILGLYVLYFVAAIGLGMVISFATRGASSFSTTAETPFTYLAVGAVAGSFLTLVASIAAAVVYVELRRLRGAGENLAEVFA